MTCRVAFAKSVSLGEHILVAFLYPPSSPPVARQLWVINTVNQKTGETLDWCQGYVQPKHAQYIDKDAIRLDSIGRDLPFTKFVFNFRDPSSTADVHVMGWSMESQIDVTPEEFDAIVKELDGSGWQGFDDEAWCK